MEVAMPYAPHCGQREILASPARFRHVSCGRRWGKSALLSTAILECILQPRKRAWLVTPIYQQGAEVWDRNPTSLIPVLRSIEAKAGVKLIQRCSERPPILELVNGSVFEIRTGDREDNLRGAGLDLLCIDEAAQFYGPWYASALRPTVADRQGRILTAGTPRGRNWWYDEWRKGKDGAADTASWQMPTNANPLFPEAEWPVMQTSMPKDLFRQECLAEFLENRATCFPKLEERMVTGGFQEPRRNAVYVHGLDLAQSQDWTVLTTIDVASRRIAQMTRLQKMPYLEQAALLAPTVTRLYPGPVWVDSTGVGVPVVEQLRVQGMSLNPYTFTQESKSALIRRLQLTIETPGGLGIPEEGDVFKTLVSELQDFEMVIGPQGKPKFGAPEGRHDDCVISLALAVWGLSGRGQTGNVNANPFPKGW
jgi:hypothetical protein